MTDTTIDQAARTTPDLGMIDRTLEEIAARPDGWNQEEWRCDTGQCFAGFTATLAGAPWMADANGRTPSGRYVRTAMGDDTDALGSALIHAPGERFVIRWRPDDYVPDAIHVKDWARARLGLTKQQAAELFNPENTLEDLWEFRDRLAADPTDDLGGATNWETL